eukprot:GHUV01045346.1.p1 GENE.GHUV01045346.1~~GHUV01045346.1.p1  ORF type:complete len:104 (+),score=14.83 GHUV01045346.1:413-724(+)
MCMAGKHRCERKDVQCLLLLQLLLCAPTSDEAFAHKFTAAFGVLTGMLACNDATLTGSCRPIACMLFISASTFAWSACPDIYQQAVSSKHSKDLSTSLLPLPC